MKSPALLPCLKSNTIKTEEKIAVATGIGVLLWIGAKAASKLYAASGLTFFPDGVSDLQFQHGHPILTLSLKAQNTSGQEITLNSLAGNVYANKTLVGNVGLFSPVTIPANKQATLPLRVEFLLIGLVNNILDAVTTGNFKQKLKLDSHANINNLQIPVPLEYEVG